MLVVVMIAVIVLRGRLGSGGVGVESGSSERGLSLLLLVVNVIIGSKGFESLVIILMVVVIAVPGSVSSGGGGPAAGLGYEVVLSVGVVVETVVVVGS